MTAGSPARTRRWLIWPLLVVCGCGAVDAVDPRGGMGGSGAAATGGAGGRGGEIGTGGSIGTGGGTGGSIGTGGGTGGSIGTGGTGGVGGRGGAGAAGGTGGAGAGGTGGAIGTGGSGGPGGSGATGGTGGSGGTGGTPPAGCPAFAPGGAWVREASLNDVLPAATGGALASGTFNLVTYTRFWGPSGTPMPANDNLRQTLVVSGVAGAAPAQTARFEFIRQIGLDAATGMARATERYTFMGASSMSRDTVTGMMIGKITITASCVDGKALPTQWRFKAAGNAITVLDGDSATMNTTGKEYVYAK